MLDIKISGGTVVDGTGSARRRADVGIVGDRIVEVAETIDDPARRTIDATDHLVTPGFVDIHTHYDGQSTWDSFLTPSTPHGVTTVLMGNCGVGFAPARPDKHDWLISLMEGVEDIPGTALSEGMTWGWESFPEYLDSVSRLPHAADVAALVPHGALRAYVMDERGATDEPATEDDITRMKAIVAEAMAAGAFGASTNRLNMHRSVDGTPVPGTYAEMAELRGIAAALHDAGGRVLEVAPQSLWLENADFEAEDMSSPVGEARWMRELAFDYDLQVSFLGMQVDGAPHFWRDLLGIAEQARHDGANLTMQTSGRPIGMLLNLDASRHPFVLRPSYRRIAQLPLPERLTAMRDPVVRASILAESTDPTHPNARYGTYRPDQVFVMGERPDYEPPHEKSVQFLAAQREITTDELIYDILTSGEGEQILLHTFGNYTLGNADHTFQMLSSDATIIGGSDGGAHCGSICDASMPTYMLTHWARDRDRGPRLSLEYVVAKQTSGTARALGFPDRGVIAAGMKADVNVIDFDRLSLDLPRVVHDLPAGGMRYVQDAHGYTATLVSGRVVRSNDEFTGELPGRLVRA